MTVKELITKSSLPPKEAALLTAFLLSSPIEFIWTHPEAIVSKNLSQKFKRLAAKRLAGWSIAVLTGQKEFYGLKFKVDKNVLVPRPETEMMVTEIIDISRRLTGPLSLLDIGTGSGAIIVTATKLLKNNCPQKYPSLLALAIDVSSLALKIAKENAKNHHQNKKIKFIKGDLLKPILRSKGVISSLLKTENLIIAANLPYLNAKQIASSPTIHREPRLALIAGSDGLKYYRQLLKQLSSLEKMAPQNTPGKRYLLCEIDPVQTKPLRALAKKYLPGCQIETKKDLAGHNRLVIISWQ